MHLNKNGWSLKEMLLLSGILVLFLLIAIYYIVSLYNNFGEEVKATNYSLLEKRLEDKALIYLNDYYNTSATCLWKGKSRI